MSRPTVVEGEIAAPPRRVYEILADVQSWGRWRASDPRVRAQPGLMRAGDEFRWSAGGAPIRSVVTRAAPGRELTWEGSSLGLVRAHHRWRLIGINGGTHVRIEESLSGPLALFLRGSLARANREWLEELKVAAEGTA